MADVDIITNSAAAADDRLGNMCPFADRRTFANNNVYFQDAPSVNTWIIGRRLR